MTTNPPNNDYRNDEDFVRSWLAPLNEDAPPFSLEIANQVNKLAGDVFVSDPSHKTTRVLPVPPSSKSSTPPRQRS
ncbi:MAG: hypothetical protein KDA84_19395, partial [Planctomycetaceae bacterium]|nr:hypothetical protein [Planctomycetaceae bacterium]